jgi:molybdopterin/thiamine biosynthesis adenylyltransferase
VRLGVGRTVLIDPDRVEHRNLNRINMATAADADEGGLKVHMLAEAIGRIGLGTRVVPLALDLEDPRAIRAVAASDMLIGCVDSW